MPRLSDLTPIEQLVAAAESIERDPIGSDILRFLDSDVAGCNDASSLMSTDAGILTCVIAGTLNCFDRAACEVLGYDEHIYLLGEDGLRDLIQMISKNIHTYTIGIETATRILSVCGLVYRFNAARKFGYPERGFMQLRLSGWGRYLCESLPLENSFDLQFLYSKISAEIAADAASYKRLISLCSSKHRPLNVIEIHELNSQLPYPMVT